MRKKEKQKKTDDVTSEVNKLAQRVSQLAENPGNVTKAELNELLRNTSLQTDRSKDFITTLNFSKKKPREFKLLGGLASALGRLSNSWKEARSSNKKIRTLTEQTEKGNEITHILDTLNASIKTTLSEAWKALPKPNLKKFVERLRGIRGGVGVDLDRPGLDFTDEPPADVVKKDTESGVHFDFTEESEEAEESDSVEEGEKLFEVEGDSVLEGHEGHEEHEDQQEQIDESIHQFDWSDNSSTEEVFDDKTIHQFDWSDNSSTEEVSEELLDALEIMDIAVENNFLTSEETEEYNDSLELVSGELSQLNIALVEKDPAKVDENAALRDEVKSLKEEVEQSLAKLEKREAKLEQRENKSELPKVFKDGIPKARKAKIDADESESENMTNLDEDSKSRLE